MYSNPTFRTFNVKGMHIEGTDNAHAVNVNEMRYNPLQLLIMWGQITHTFWPSIISSE